ncbi:Glutathione synthetase [Dionaea muscipula]
MMRFEVSSVGFSLLRRWWVINMVGLVFLFSFGRWLDEFECSKDDLVLHFDVVNYLQRSGTVPTVGMVHTPFSLLPMPFLESHWNQECELAPIFNELIDRVILDGKFLQDYLSRTKNVDDFTSRLLDIHSRVIEMNKTEVCGLLSIVLVDPL